MGDIIRKATSRNWAFWVSLTISVGLGITGFFMPPKGAIDGSVLTFAGELFGYAALHSISKAIANGANANVKHGKTEVTIGDINK